MATSMQDIPRRKERENASVAPTQLPEEDDTEALELMSKLKTAMLDAKASKSQTDSKQNGNYMNGKNNHHDDDEDENGLPNQVPIEYTKEEIMQMNKRGVDEDNIDQTARPLPKEVEEGNIEYKVCYSRIRSSHC